MAKLRFNKKFSVTRVIGRLMESILGLYVGGTMIAAFGTAMNCTQSALYEGLTLIGWTVSDTVNTTTTCTDLGSGEVITNANAITDTTGGAILSVLGIIAIASVVLEFVRF